MRLFVLISFLFYFSGCIPKNYHTADGKACQQNCLFVYDSCNRTSSCNHCKDAYHECLSTWCDDKEENARINNK